jgi:hypothetical protein
MATKRKSIIEEALLEAKSLEDALKANTKEMLASHMKEEIENIVESSLNEEDEEVEELDINVEGSDEEMEEMPAEAGEDSEESELMDLEIDLDALAGDDDEEVELDVATLPMELDMGDEGELDLTGASDEEVIAVFKKMSDEDEVEVVKDADGIHLTDNETGAEYYIKEQHELDDVEEGYDLDEDEDGLCEGCSSKSMDEDEEVMYEIELEEDDKYGQGSHEYRRHNVDGVEKRSGEGPEVDGHRHFKDYMEEGEELEEDDKYGQGSHEYRRHNVDGVEKRSGEGPEVDGHRHFKDYMEETLDLDEEDGIEEDLMKRHQSTGYQRYSGAKAGSDQASPYGGVSESKKRRTPKNVQRVSESKIMKEYKELKSKNEEYKGALKVFKNKLNEVALFNTNLAYVNRLFTEHSTTKSEKMEILKRFDNAESIKESKSIYKSVKSELDTKSPITESVENKVNKTVKSSKSDLNESTAYVDPQITAIKDLMRKLS